MSSNRISHRSARSWKKPRRQAQIIVLPETSTSGYIYKDRRQFDPYLDTVPGQTTDAIAKLTKRFDCYVTVGIAEIDRSTGLAYNTGALIGPDGYIGKYRKVGLNSDDQLWFTIGNLGYPVFETKYGKLAMEICYDDTYWEVGRTAAVKGTSQIICFMSSSDKALPGKPGSAGNHSTISSVQGINSWNGVALIATDRNNSETNPTTGLTVYCSRCRDLVADRQETRSGSGHYARCVCYCSESDYLCNDRSNGVR
ncbi:MAG: nitrilase-related carbon-nitrogen hydrolase [Hyphomonadaceae bacterium]